MKMKRWCDSELEMTKMRDNAMTMVQWQDKSIARWYDIDDEMVQ